MYGNIGLMAKAPPDIASAGGTISGNLVVTGSIDCGALTPSSVTVDSGGDIIMQGTGQIHATAGTPDDPGLTVGDPNSGLARVGGATNIVDDGARSLDCDGAQVTAMSGLTVSSTLLALGNIDHNGTAIGFNNATPVTRQTYTPTNVTTDRSFDADTVLVAELADVVGTLIADLQARGDLG